MLPHQTSLQAVIDLCDGNQSELSRRSGVSQQMISYYLTSAKTIPFHVAQKISDAVDGKVTVDAFFKEDEGASSAA